MISRSTVLAAASLLALTVAAGTGISASARTSPQRALGVNGRIAFVANVKGAKQQIFTIRPNGKGLKQVTNLRGDPGPGAADPSWAPDGSRIAFNAATKYGPPLFNRVNLFTIAPDGSGLTELPLESGNFHGDPAYSPDGLQISFDWDPGRNEPATTVNGIFIANSDGSNERRLTTTLSRDTFDTESQWSPDGQTIAFTRVKSDKKAAIFTIGVDGSGLTQLTPYKLDAASPDWSPDGQTIAFNSYWDTPHGNVSRVITMKPDGSEQRAITSDHFAGGGVIYSFRPSWSPDGKRIVFARCKVKGDNGTCDLHTMDPDGSDLDRVTNMSDTFPVNPDWGTAP
jgi:Tol biopolymer transport system component